MERLKRLDELTKSDLESIRLMLRGDSIIDWHRMNFESEAEAREFILSQEMRPDEDMARLEALKNEMRGYLERGYKVVKKKIGGAPLAEDLRRIEAILSILPAGCKLADERLVSAR